MLKSKYFIVFFFSNKKWRSPADNDFGGVRSFQILYRKSLRVAEIFYFDVTRLFRFWI